jgi:hypothetical protein
MVLMAKAFYTRLYTLLVELSPSQEACPFKYSELKPIFIQNPFFSAKVNEYLWADMDTYSSVGQVKKGLMEKLKRYEQMPLTELLKHLQAAQVKSPQIMHNLAENIFQYIKIECETPANRYKNWLLNMRQENELHKLSFGQNKISWAKFKAQIKNIKDVCKTSVIALNIASAWEQKAKQIQDKDADTASVDQFKLYDLLQKILETQLNTMQQNLPVEDEIKKLPGVYPFSLGQNSNTIINNNTTVNNTTVQNHNPKPVNVEIGDSQFKFKIENKGSNLSFFGRIQCKQEKIANLELPNGVG